MSYAAPSRIEEPNPEASDDELATPVVPHSRGPEAAGPLGSDRWPPQTTAAKESELPCETAPLEQVSTMTLDAHTAPLQPCSR